MSFALPARPERCPAWRLIAKSAGADPATCRVGRCAQILLTEATEVSIDAFLADAARVEIGLSSGSVAALVGRPGPADSLDTSPPTLSSGVRGTEFAVSHTGDDTTVAVREGVVVLKPAGIEDALPRLRVNGYAAINQVVDSLPSLSSGQKSTISRGRSPRVSRTTRQPLKSLRRRLPPSIRTLAQECRRPLQILLNRSACSGGIRR